MDAMDLDTNETNPPQNKSADTDSPEIAITNPSVSQASTKPKKTSSSSSAVTQRTLRTPPWTYIHLKLQTTTSSTSTTSTTPNPTQTPSPTPLDAITARKYLTAALQQFLGLTGTAIPIDLLKVEAQDVWIRVPREDGGAVVAAVGGWVGRGDDGGGDSGSLVGWRVEGRDDWIAKLVGGTGQDLFR